MIASVIMHDWRTLERIVGLTHRLGCAYTRIDVRADGDRYHGTLEFVGPADALRRLDSQLTRLLANDKEMSR